MQSPAPASAHTQVNYHSSTDRRNSAFAGLRRTTVGVGVRTYVCTNPCSPPPPLLSTSKTSTRSFSGIKIFTGYTFPYVVPCPSCFLQPPPLSAIAPDTRSASPPSLPYVCICLWYAPDAHRPVALQYFRTYIYAPSSRRVGVWHPQS